MPSTSTCGDWTRSRMVCRLLPPGPDASSLMMILRRGWAEQRVVVSNKARNNFVRIIFILAHPSLAHDNGFRHDLPALSHAAFAGRVDRRADLFCFRAGAHGISGFAEHSSGGQRRGSRVGEATLDCDCLRDRISAQLASLQPARRWNGASFLSAQCVHLPDARTYAGVAVLDHSADGYAAGAGSGFRGCGFG